MKRIISVLILLLITSMIVGIYNVQASDVDDVIEAIKKEFAE